jgi:hypothetical protein
MLMKSLTVRTVAPAILALFTAVLAALTFTHWTSAVPVRNLTLVYVGADNCSPCNIWQQSQKMTFRVSAEFHHIKYREVKSATLFDVLNDNNWPEELRIYRQAIGRGAGVPLWLVIADDQIVLQSSGLTQWQEVVLPKIKSLLH